VVSAVINLQGETLVLPDRVLVNGVEVSKTDLINAIKAASATSRRNNTHEVSTDNLLNDWGCSHECCVSDVYCDCSETNDCSCVNEWNCFSCSIVLVGAEDVEIRKHIRSEHLGGAYRRAAKNGKQLWGDRRRHVQMSEDGYCPDCGAVIDYCSCDAKLGPGPEEYDCFDCGAQFKEEAHARKHIEETHGFGRYDVVHQGVNRDREWTEVSRYIDLTVKRGGKTFRLHHEPVEQQYCAKSPGYLEGAGYAAGWLYPVDDETEEAVPSPVSFEEGKAHGNETQKHSNEMHGAEEKGRPGAVSTQKNSNTSSSIPFAGLKHDLSRIGSVDKGKGKEAIHEAIDWTCGSEVNGGVSQHQNNGAVQRVRLHQSREWTQLMSI